MKADDLPTPADKMPIAARAGTDDFIKSRIFTVRGLQVVVDRDLAELYGVQTKVLNQAVKRNANRFPPEFMFVLAKDETEELVTNCDRFASMKHSSVPMRAFSEHGVIMVARGTKGTLLYMFYCICLDECYWIPRQFARRQRLSHDGIRGRRRLPFVV